ncbi:MAG: 5-oxoprolinase subunit PxpB [Pseudomonadales bacterium]
MTTASLIPVGDSALLIEFENRIDPDINAQVLRLKQRLDASHLQGIIEVVPSYRSLLIQYSCITTSLERLSEKVATLIDETGAEQSDSNCWRVPVLYGGEAGCDLDDVARLHEMSTADVIRLHGEAVFRVYMLGFAPGWCYLGGLPESLHTPRLKSPRLQVPKGCISIGGQQGMIGALAMPSGWRLLGQTPVRSYDPNRQPPFIIEAGDEVQFYPVDSNEYLRLEQAAEKGDPLIEAIASGKEQ